MTKKQVEAQIGKTSITQGHHDKDDIMGTHVLSVYGKSERLWLNFYDINYKTKFDNAKLATMTFVVEDKNITKKALEKYTGKATGYQGSMKSSKNIARYYGNLGVVYYKDKATWKVAEFGMLSPINEIGMHEYGYKEGRKLPVGVKLPDWIKE